MTVGWVGAGVALTRLAAAESTGVMPPPPPPEQPRPASLNWVRGAGAEACPGPNALAIAVEARLGRRVFVAASAPELAVEAYVRNATDFGFEVVLQLSGPDGKIFGRRELRSPERDCTSIIDSVVLAIALMIDPEAKLVTPTLSTPNAPLTVPPTAPLLVLSAIPPRPFILTAASDAPIRPMRASLVVSGAVAAGLLPVLSPGIGVTARVVPNEWPLGIELGGSYYPARQALSRSATPSVLEAGASFSALVFHLSPCWVADVRDRKLTVSLCGGAGVGALSAMPLGVQGPPRAASALLFDAELRGDVTGHILDSVLVAFGLNLAVPLAHYTAHQTVDGQPKTVFQRPDVGGGAEIGVGFEF